MRAAEGAHCPRHGFVCQSIGAGLVVCWRLRCPDRDEPAAPGASA